MLFSAVLLTLACFAISFRDKEAEAKEKEGVACKQEKGMGRLE